MWQKHKNIAARSYTEKWIQNTTQKLAMTSVSSASTHNKNPVCMMNTVKEINV